MKTLKEIKEILSEHKNELSRKYGVTELGIFGSYVRDEAQVTSDLDILIEFDENVRISLLDFIHIERYLSDLLGLKVDLVEKSALKPGIGRHILSEVIYL
ncbi:nucleotidyltransferase [candidate division WOR-3 bacterium]|uniref:Nucleotidyltransferase n=1 Tax=candidate division WOR-3 bacterium TaxID=2052148 RepID=A0A9D5QC62_UNCW3|nr:nucleotidyltransferase [candidate division WOR-3 bacterium]MBD3363686.1 nucleotidyltransferase [candidate division WOR-3 bacterium]